MAAHIEGYYTAIYPIILSCVAQLFFHGFDRFYKHIHVITNHHVLPQKYRSNIPSLADTVYMIRGALGPQLPGVQLRTYLYDR